MEMKRSAYAKHLGISYQTAWRLWQRGALPAHQLPSGTVRVEVPPHVLETHRPQHVVGSARVSSAEHRTHVDSQAERGRALCGAHGWQAAGGTGRHGLRQRRQRSAPAVPGAPGRYPQQP
jgi:putative resolvase